MSPLMVFVIALVAAAAAAAPSFNDEIVAGMDANVFCDSNLAPIRDLVLADMRAASGRNETRVTRYFAQARLLCGPAQRNQLWALADSLCAADVGLNFFCNVSHTVEGSNGLFVPFTVELRDPVTPVLCHCGPEAAAAAAAAPVTSVTPPVVEEADDDDDDTDYAAFERETYTHNNGMDEEAVDERRKPVTMSGSAKKTTKQPVAGKTKTKAKAKK